MSATHDCPSCGTHDVETFYEVLNVPVHSCIMSNTVEDATSFPVRDIVMGVCRGCGFVWNVAFDAAVQDYHPGYEDQQSFSPTFNSFAGRLAQHLIDKYEIRKKRIVEIGCGKGDFLALMCELGENWGVGIDPTCIKERIRSSANDRIEIIQDYYSESYSGYTGDLMMCRHTLEHIHDTRAFLRTIRRGIGKSLNTLVFFEVPDVVIVLKDVVFWDIYYEHCSLFSPGSLARMFRDNDFDVIDLYRDYDDQYLMIDAVPAAGIPSSLHPLEEAPETIVSMARDFSGRVKTELNRWRQRIDEMNAAGKRPVIWGSGSKCVAFMTTLGLKDEIGAVVDINPYRQGKFIPGVGKQVVAPESLRSYEPESIIVMNPVYKGEITEMVRGMALDPEVLTV